jgi:hypothetical protein
VVAGEEKIRGGVARRYRYPIEPHRPVAPEERHALHQAIASELIRRSALQSADPGVMTDAELWVDPEVFRGICQRVFAESKALHEAAQPPRTPGAVRVNATISLFEMEPSA